MSALAAPPKPTSLLLFAEQQHLAMDTKDDVKRAKEMWSAMSPEDKAKYTKSPELARRLKAWKAEHGEPPKPRVVDQLKAAASRCRRGVESLRAAAVAKEVELPDSVNNFDTFLQTLTQGKKRKARKSKGGANGINGDDDDGGDSSPDDEPAKRSKSDDDDGKFAEMDTDAIQSLFMKKG